MSIDTAGAYEPAIPAIVQAHEQGMFLYEETNQLFASPEALVRLQREGRFRWGAVNWRLVPPNSREVTEIGSGYRK